MTRREFIENIEEFNDLIQFCWDEGLGDLIDVFSAETLNERVFEVIVDYDRYNDWRDVYNFLGRIPTNYAWYTEDDWGDYIGVSDEEFPRYKQTVLEAMDEDGAWDDEEDEHETEPDYANMTAEASEETEDISDEAFSALFFAAC